MILGNDFMYKLSYGLSDPQNYEFDLYEVSFLRIDFWKWRMVSECDTKGWRDKEEIDQKTRYRNMGDQETGFFSLVEIHCGADWQSDTHIHHIFRLKISFSSNIRPNFGFGGSWKRSSYREKGAFSDHKAPGWSRLVHLLPPLSATHNSVGSTLRRALSLLLISDIERIEHLGQRICRRGLPEISRKFDREFNALWPVQQANSRDTLCLTEGIGQWHIHLNQSEKPCLHDRRLRNTCERACTESLLNWENRNYIVFQKNVPFSESHFHWW